MSACHDLSNFIWANTELKKTNAEILGLLNEVSLEARNP